jgi:signal peptidase I
VPVADVINPTGPEEKPSTEPEPAAQSDTDTMSETTSAGRRPSRSKRSKRRKRPLWRELPILIGVVLTLTVLIQVLVARVYVIPSESMEATLHGCDGCQNDRVIAERLSYRFSAPTPGDVVIFRSPDTWGRNDVDASATDPVTRFFRWSAALVGLEDPNEQDFVKRVIATGGQTVQCCDMHNRVLVDGKPLNEPYVHWEPGRGTRQHSFAPVTVPPGNLWVMGDNRNDSADSRIQGGGGVRGTVPVANVIGKAQFIVLPLGRMGHIPNPNPQAR